MSLPPEPLGLTVHSMPVPDVAMAHRRSSGRVKMLLVLLVCAAPVVASYVTYFVIRPQGSTAYGSLIQPAVPMPRVDGLLLDGRRQALRGLAGQWLLVVVDSGACNADCEKRLFLQRQLREMTGREADRIDKLLVLVDDTPLSPALQKALLASPAMNILRLPRATVAAWLRPAAGHALDDHLYIVDPLGDWMMRAPADADPNKLKRDIDRLLRGSAGWDKPGRQALIEAPAAGAGASAAGATAARP